uniref:Uncharacterized protein n=1 Tax=Pseudomonas phage Touem01 TaxID=3138548 RepID=A0AAU6W2J7_9VIRU
MTPIIKTYTGQTQGKGVFVIPLDPSFSRIQVDVEASSAATGGTLKLQFVTPGLTAPKSFLDDSKAAISINMAAPYPVSMSDLSLSQLIVTPVGFDADKSFTVGIVQSGAL